MTTEHQTPERLTDEEFNILGEIPSDALSAEEWHMAYAEAQRARSVEAAQAEELERLRGERDETQRKLAFALSRLNRDASRLADEVAVLIKRKVIDSRDPAADALLDFRDPPTTERSNRLASLECALSASQARETQMAAVVETLKNERGDLLDLIDSIQSELPEDFDQAAQIHAMLDHAEKIDAQLAALSAPPGRHEPADDGLLHDRIGPASGRLLASKPVLAPPGKAEEPVGCKGCGHKAHPGACTWMPPSPSEYCMCAEMPAEPLSAKEPIVTHNADGSLRWDLGVQTFCDGDEASDE